MKKKKTYVPPGLNCYAMELEQMMAGSGDVGNENYPTDPDPDNGFYNAGGIGKKIFGQDKDDSYGFGSWDEVLED